MAYITTRRDKNGQTRYRVQIRLKGAPSLSATFSRKTDAKRWVQQEESKIREGRHFHGVEAKRHTVSELIKRYKETILPQKPKSMAKQGTQLDWWDRELGFLLLSDLIPARIAEARDKLAAEKVRGGKQRGPATVKRYLAVLSHACTIAAKEWGWLEMNPVKNVTKPREPQGRVRFLSEEERKILLEVCQKSSNPYLYTIVVLAISTGMRKGEILSLKWRDVSLDKGRIILNETKNGERRAVSLTGHALALLTDQAKVRQIDDDHVFPAKRPKHGKPRPADIRLPWEIALKEAKIDDFHFHDLRHSTASYLAMNGASLAEIAEVLGHKTLQMVKRYSHLSESHTASVLEKMNEKLF